MVPNSITTQMNAVCWVPSKNGINSHPATGKFKLSYQGKEVGVAILEAGAVGLYVGVGHVLAVADETVLN